MTKAVLTCMHNYVPMHDHKYFDVLFDYFMHNFKKYWQGEVDKLYLIDSNWGIKDISNPKVEVLKVNPNLRYYEAYKEVLPKVKEDLVLFLDNDMVIYRKGIVKKVFKKLEDHDVVSIYDTIGEKTFKELNGKSKFCPYFFATKKDLLMKYRDCEWGPVPWGETLSELTLKMLEDRIKPFEIEEDKNSIYFDGTKDEPKNLGYYHVRSGSSPAFLLTHKFFGNYKTYEDYMVNQPRREYLRQIAWFYEMCDVNKKNWMIREDIYKLLEDIHIDKFQWMDYHEKFRKFHGLIK